MENELENESEQENPSGVLQGKRKLKKPASSPSASTRKIALSDELQTVPSTPHELERESMMGYRVICQGVCHLVQLHRSKFRDLQRAYLHQLITQKEGEKVMGIASSPLNRDTSLRLSPTNSPSKSPFHHTVISSSTIPEVDNPSQNDGNAIIDGVASVDSPHSLHKNKGAPGVLERSRSRSKSIIRLGARRTLSSSSIARQDFETELADTHSHDSDTSVLVSMASILNKAESESTQRRLSMMTTSSLDSKRNSRVYLFEEHLNHCGGGADESGGFKEVTADNLFGDKKYDYDEIDGKNIGT